MKIIALILFFLAGLNEDIPHSWEKACLKEVKKTFDIENVTINRQTLDIDGHGRPSPGIVLYYLLDGEDQIGYAVLTSAKGRHDYFDYIVIYDADLTILRVRVFEYRSDYGYEICNKKWLSQFEGSKGCNLKYETDIDAISGATYSASSITEDLSYLCYYLTKNLK
jgi:Na+-translocating ferredoxin:NAD+ oxidoreductase RnfG subunit